MRQETALEDLIIAVLTSCSRSIVTDAVVQTERTVCGLALSNTLLSQVSLPGASCTATLRRDEEGSISYEILGRNWQLSWSGCSSRLPNHFELKYIMSSACCSATYVRDGLRRSE
jgi:hypothetical protein